jgi:hypothetical protein
VTHLPRELGNPWLEGFERSLRGVVIGTPVAGDPGVVKRERSATGEHAPRCGCPSAPQPYEGPLARSEWLVCARVSRLVAHVLSVASGGTRTARGAAAGRGTGDLGAGGRDHVPQGAKAGGALAVSLPRRGVSLEEVERMLVVSHLL